MQLVWAASWWLNWDALAEYQNARDNLLNLLKDKKSDCAKFLLEKLDLSGSRVAKAVLGLRPFDGTQSTISMGEAGLVSLSGGIQFYNLQVKDVFASRPGTNAITAGSIRARFRDVYFRPGAITTPRIL